MKTRPTQGVRIMAMAGLLLAMVMLPSPRSAAAAQELQPPEWVKPGMRLVYWTGTYTRQSSGTVFVRDPEGPIKDDQGGRWRIVFRGSDRKGSDLGPVAGMGYSVIDIVAIENGRVVFDTRALTVLQRGVHFTGRTGAHHNLTTGDGAWLDAGQLERLQNRRLMPGEAIGPYRLADGRGIDLAYFNRHGPTGHTIFDLDTGVQASDFMRAKVIPGKNAGPTGRLTDAHRETIALAYLKSMRKVELPWADGTPPGWVANTRTLHYRGTKVVQTPGVPQISQPTERVATLDHAGERYALYTERSFDVLGGVRQLASTTTLATGPASIGGYWIDPAKLEDLRPGTVLDRDPVTGVTVTVGQPQRFPNGATALTIVERGTHFQKVFAYDTATGVLATIHQTADLTTGRIVAQLTLQNPPR